jgi:hypothetical protein
MPRKFMNLNSISTHIRIVLAVCVAVLSLATLGYVVYKSTYAPRLAQHQQRDTSLVKLFGPGGRNVRNAGQTVDMMNKSFNDRLSQVEADCNKKKIPDAERSRLLQATYDVYKAENDKVVASRYQAPFEPHYPPLP